MGSMCNLGINSSDGQKALHHIVILFPYKCDIEYIIICKAWRMRRYPHFCWHEHSLGWRSSKGKGLDDWQVEQGCFLMKIQARQVSCYIVTVQNATNSHRKSQLFHQIIVKKWNIPIEKSAEKKSHFEWLCLCVWMCLHVYLCYRAK